MNDRQIFELICALAPNPELYEIETQLKMDHNRNPYNDSHKPKLRSRMEIIVDYKIAFARMLCDKVVN